METTRPTKDGDLDLDSPLIGNDNVKTLRPETKTDGTLAAVSPALVEDEELQILYAELEEQREQLAEALFESIDSMRPLPASTGGGGVAVDGVGGKCRSADGVIAFSRSTTATFSARHTSVLASSIARDTMARASSSASCCCFSRRA